MTQPAPQLKMPLAPRVLQRSMEFGGLTWLDFIYPGEDQARYLRQRYGFHPLHLADMRAHLQRPKIDDAAAQNYLFLVLHIPIINELRRVPVISEVCFFVGPDYVITTHDGKLRPLVYMLFDCERKDDVREQLMSRGPGYLFYRIGCALLEPVPGLVSALYERLDHIDADMFVQDTRALIQELSFTRRDIISFRRIVRPNIGVTRTLAASDRPYLQLDEGTYFGDMTDTLARVWDMLEEQKELVESLDATLGSLTSHRINREMRVFTLITVIFLPMTLVASVLGMNVIIPFAEYWWSLPLALLVMGSLAGVMMMFLKRGGWL